MDVSFDGGVVRGNREARERFYDARGYGRPRGSDLELAPVEAAHLLFRGDLDTVRDVRPEAESGTRLGFRELLASAAVSEVAFLVYAELRERGFYLSPVRDGIDREFVVYPRGQGPWDDTVAYRVQAVSEREDVPAAALQRLLGRADATAVLAVVDEESEVTYLELGEPAPEGTTDHELSTTTGVLLADRVLVDDPPAGLYERAFYGQLLGDDTVQLSLVETAHLAGNGLLTVETGDGTAVAADEAMAAVLDRGRRVEGERFDRRYRVYDTLREAGVVPKTGFKFGADFRTYAAVDSVEDLGHSERLVRVLPGSHTFAPRDLALDVRLAHGVRKEMVFALTDGESVDWLTAGRLTP